MSTKPNVEPSLATITSEELRNRLLEVTIGGSGHAAKEIDSDSRDQVFSEYIQRALPDTNVQNIKTLSSAASLNSVMASGDIEKHKYFFKIHIESAINKNAEAISALGVGGEYENAELLAKAGWPVYTPYLKGPDPGYPLLVYKWTDAPTLFEKLESSYSSGVTTISSADFEMLESMNAHAGSAMRSSLRKVLSREAATAPIQTFFARRFEKGGRVSQWYRPDTKFLLPGMNGIPLELNWETIKSAKWNINGLTYDMTFETIIARARDVLTFQGEKDAFATTSHGDDHAGNIFIGLSEESGDKTSAKVFDPAAAGDTNPAILGDVKAFAHNCLMPMAGMYYDPKMPDTSYNYDTALKKITVTADFDSAPQADTHKALARQIIDTRIAPLLISLKQQGADMQRELDRFRCGLVCCAMLTVKIPLLLAAQDQRGIGLLPMAIMSAELQGLPALEMLSEQFSRIT